MNNFETIDISGDVGVRALGENCTRALENAGLGMYALVTDIGSVEEKERRTVEVEADTPERIIVDYLNDLIFYFDTYGFIGKRIEIDNFEVDKDSRMKVIAVIHGEEFDPERHERRLLLKAATYHRLQIKQTESRCEIEVIFDI